jgi:hypothetical protein
MFVKTFWHINLWTLCFLFPQWTLATIQFPYVQDKVIVKTIKQIYEKAPAEKDFFNNLLNLLPQKKKEFFIELYSQAAGKGSVDTSQFKLEFISETEVIIYVGKEKSEIHFVDIQKGRYIIDGKSLHLNPKLDLQIQWDNLNKALQPKESLLQSLLLQKANAISAGGAAKWAGGKVLKARLWMVLIAQQAYEIGAASAAGCLAAKQLGAFQNECKNANEDLKYNIYKIVESGAIKLDPPKCLPRNQQLLPLNNGQDIVVQNGEVTIPFKSNEENQAINYFSFKTTENDSIKLKIFDDYGHEEEMLIDKDFEQKAIHLDQEIYKTSMETLRSLKLIANIAKLASLCCPPKNTKESCEKYTNAVRNYQGVKPTGIIKEANKPGFFERIFQTGPKSKPAIR